ncbi:MAG: FlgD immunoglobulin-like domain containing protein [candidate division WOR-3 bacterium]
MSNKYIAVVATIMALLTIGYADTLLLENFDSVTPPNLPSGWVVIDDNSDGKTWGLSTSHPHTAPNCLRYVYSRTNSANDWVFTPGLTLEAGVTYTVEFYYRASSPSMPEKMRIYLATAQDPYAIVGSPVWDNNNITNTMYLQGMADFTVATSGTYYLGFQCYSDPDRWNLRVDDIAVYKQVHDVGIDTIYSPLPGVYSVGASFTPRFLVRNYGQNTGGEIVYAYAKIIRYPIVGDPETLYTYGETLRVEVCTPVEVTGPTWYSQYPCNHKFVAWTEIAGGGDMNPDNDSKEVEFAIEYRDVRPIAITVPPSYMQWCSESIPTATVKNEGHQTESFWVYFKSLDASSQQEYLDSFYVTNLGAGQQTTVTFAKWHFPVCQHTAVVWTKLDGDENPTNDTITQSYTVYLIDAEITQVIAPDTVIACQYFPVTITVHNNGPHYTLQPGWDIVVDIYDDLNNLVAEEIVSISDPLPYCSTLTVAPTLHIPNPCIHRLVVTANYPDDQAPNNNTYEKTIYAASIDAHPVEIVAPETVQMGVDFGVAVKVHNNSQHYVLEPGWPVYLGDGVRVDTEYVNVALMPCETVEVYFTWNFGEPCEHTLTATTDYPGDQNGTNNAIQKSIVVYALDVEPVAINAPSVVKVGEAFDVTVTVHNNGEHSVVPGGWYTYLAVGNLVRDSVLVTTDLGYCQNADVTFEDVVISEPCDHEIVVWTALAGDQRPENDTTSVNITVQYYDWAVTEIYNVPDTVTYCEDIHPYIVVTNNDVHVAPRSATVHYALYRNDLLITDGSIVTDVIGPGEADTVDFTYHPDEPCNWRLVATVEATDDQNANNDMMTKDFVVRYYNVEVISILNVPDTVDVCNWINAQVVVHNNGVHVPSQEGDVEFSILRSHDGINYYQVYTTSTHVTLNWCEPETLTFSWHADSACWHKVVVYANFTPDHNVSNNSLEETFVVRYQDVVIANITVPGDTVISCNSIIPVVEVINSGEHNGPAECTVRMRIWRFATKLDSLCHISPDTTKEIVLYDTFVVTTVDPGVNLVNMPPIHFYHADVYWVGHHHRISATISTANDQDPVNNSTSKQFIVKAHDHDLQVDYLGLLFGNQVIPDSIITVGISYNPISVISNSPFGPTASFRTWYKITRMKDNVTVYSRYLDRTLAARQYSCLYFYSGWVPTDSGYYRCETWIVARPGVDLIAENSFSSRVYYARLTTKPTLINEGSIASENSSLPQVFALAPNYPNPVFGMTTIKWQIPEATHVTLVIYDATGRKVATLVNETYQPGYYETIWNGTDAEGRKVSAGIYFYEMKAGSYLARRKMVVSR